MLPLAALSLIVLLLTQIQFVSQLHITRAQNAEHLWRTHSVARLADGVRQYTLENNQVPASLSQLAATAGFEYLKQDVEAAWQGYQTASLTDSTWQYTRAAIYSLPDSTTRVLANPLDSNDCKTSGPGVFATDTTWCGTKKYYWHLVDTRETYANQIDTERLSQTRLIRKFAAAYMVVTDNKQQFPKPATTSDTLANLAGINTPPAPNAVNCQLAYHWQGVPLDCSDLFSVWGTDRRYEWLSEDRIAITAVTPFKNKDGNAVPVITVYDLDNMPKD